MSEWKQDKFSSVATILMGQSPSGETCNTKGDGVPLLNGPTEFGIKYPTPVQYTLDPKKCCDLNDILFCVRGSTTGRMNWANQPFAIGRGLAALRHKSGKAYQYFLKGLIDYHLPSLLQSASGSTFPNVSGSDLANLEIVIPPLIEQKNISELIGSLDDKIDLLHRQNITLEQLAEIFFRQWLVNEKLNANLSDYIRVQNGYAFKSKDFQENGFAGIIKIRNISMGMIDINNHDCVDESVVKNIDNRFKIKSGDFLIAMTGAEIGKIGIVEKTNKEIWVNQRVGKLVAKVPYGDLIGYLALKSREGQEHIINACAGSAQENISSTGIEEMDFVSYKKEKIDLLGKVVQPFFEKIIFNQGQIRTLTQLRDTLLPKLMSGDINIIN